MQVVRHFEDDDVVHVEGGPDPLRDVEIINTELILADLQMVENLLGGLQRKLKSNDPQVKKLCTILEKMQSYLAEGKLAYDITDSLSEGEQMLLKPYNFLTYKPFIYALNVSEENLVHAEKLCAEYQQILKKPVTAVCAKFESEIMELEPDEKELFVEELKQ